jgi:signal transduction histidine kinase
MRNIMLVVLCWMGLFPQLAAQSNHKSMPERLEYLQSQLTTNWQDLFPEAESFYQDAQEYGDPSLLAEALNIKGALYFRKSQMDSASYFYQKAIELNLREGFEENLAKNYVNMAFIFQQTGRYPEAIESATNAGVIFEKRNDMKGRALVYNVIGSVYYYLDNLSEAEKAMRNYVRYAEESGDLAELASAYGNLSSVLSRLDLQESIAFREKQAAIFEKSENKLGQANALHNVGTTYYEQGDYEAALPNLSKSLALAEAIPVPRLILEAHFNLGLTLKALDRIDEAFIHLDKAITQAREMEELYYLMRAQIAQSDVLARKGRFSEAFTLLKEGEDLRYTLMNEENNERIAELETAYELEIKENEIAQLEQEKALQAITLQRNRVVQAGLALALFLMIALGITIQGRNKARQQAAIEAIEGKLKEEQINAVIRSQENERKRFAEDLHDGFGQLISALKLNISRLDAENPQPITKQDRDLTYQNSIQILNDMYGEVRNIAFNLMPAVLVKKGLVAAAEQLAERFGRSGVLSMEVQAYDIPPRLDELTEISLYRVLQEVLNNIVKYAEATEVQVQFVNHEEELVLTVEDNGKGFDPDAFKESKGNGWNNIRSRLNLIKAEIEIDAMEGRRGSTYIINVPLQVNQKEPVLA